MAQSNKLLFPGLAGRPDDWLEKQLIAASSPNREYLNQWTVGENDMSKVVYNFYFDQKYHWIVKCPNGQDRVMDPDYWATLFNIPEMFDGCHYFGTEVVDQFYGTMRMNIEVEWRDGMPRKVNLTSPDGDPVKQDLKRFHILIDRVA